MKRVQVVFLSILFLWGVFLNAGSQQLNSFKLVSDQLRLFHDDNFKLKIRENLFYTIDQMALSGSITPQQVTNLKQNIDLLIQYSLNANENQIISIIDANSSSQVIVYNDEFAGCENLRDEELKRKLRYLTGKNYHSIGYRTARRLIFTKIDNFDNKVEDLYTGRVIIVHNTVPNPSNMNIEHVWPQSWGATGVAKSDMHHLYPCDSKANSRRGSYPFGIVSDEDIEWSVGGSKYGHHRFEPRDEVKGDVARAFFYFAIRYNKHIKDNQERILKAWHEMDPPDDKELKREMRVYGYQKNHNPFVLHPELVNQISDF